ncbi:signal recognition particle receptor subunit beta [Catenulispora sp. EB89]|uniref:GTP-binding protein n=1 Tax=Catenulispora sp. EB89 TaxID=3156257 RepID=UPI003519C596
MGSANLSEVAYLPGTVTRSVKLLVAGPFGVGKTTFVGSVSEIRPLRTEEMITEASVGVDDLAGLPAKTSTTVAMDFGRRTFGGVALYLFGTPGQHRFLPMWDELARGALGALVLVDTRRLDHADEILSAVEKRDIPYTVAVNQFDGARRYPDEEIREALDLAPGTPLTSCDARDQASSARALIVLVEHLTSSRTSRPSRPEMFA